jgi:hypothetical protein
MQCAQWLLAGSQFSRLAAAPLPRESQRRLLVIYFFVKVLWRIAFRWRAVPRVDTVLHFRRLHGASAGWKRILCTVGLFKCDVARDERITSAAYHTLAVLLDTMTMMITTTMMMMVVVMMMVMMIMMVMVVVMMEMASSSPRYRHHARSFEQHQTSQPRKSPFVALIQDVATLISKINMR